MHSPKTDLYREVALVTMMLEHPAGFTIDVFGTMGVRGTENDGFEVWWDKEVSEHHQDHWRFRTGDGPWRLYESAKRAARLFCHLRRVVELGVDIESELWRASKEDDFGTDENQAKLADAFKEETLEARQEHDGLLYPPNRRR